ncbi:hypothetical protein E2C01_061261 [Portunus trituberculatus]|uniref:Uncharacterized protein n=1 Tax=Portunus trituberculatus TaxID=210409 RepID=A0A5B7HAT6_PORTR|nr:hypothetical protein [Portunus trituberculatus]
MTITRSRDIAGRYLSIRLSLYSSSAGATLASHFLSCLGRSATCVPRASFPAAVQVMARGQGGAWRWSPWSPCVGLSRGQGGSGNEAMIGWAGREAVAERRERGSQPLTGYTAAVVRRLGPYGGTRRQEGEVRGGGRVVPFLSTPKKGKPRRFVG